MGLLYCSIKVDKQSRESGKDTCIVHGDLWVAVQVLAPRQLQVEPLV